MLDYLSKIVSSENNVENSDFKKLSSSGCFEIINLGEVALVKTLTYMNESGKVAKLVLKNLKAEAGSLIVVHDDSDIKLGEYKISFGRSSAGHNGVQSIIESLGTKNFWRLRIGIRKKDIRKKASELVLKKITVGNAELMCSAFQKATKEIFPASPTKRGDG